MSTRRNRTRETRLPAINLDGEQSDINAAVKENVEVLTGVRGQPIDRAVTVRDLIAAGLIDSEDDLNG